MGRGAFWRIHQLICGLETSIAQRERWRGTGARRGEPASGVPKGASYGMGSGSAGVRAQRVPGRCRGHFGDRSERATLGEVVRFPCRKRSGAVRQFPSERARQQPARDRGETLIFQLPSCPDLLGDPFRSYQAGSTTSEAAGPGVIPVTQRRALSAGSPCSLFSCCVRVTTVRRCPDRNGWTVQSSGRLPQTRELRCAVMLLDVAWRCRRLIPTTVRSPFSHDVQPCRREHTTPTTG